MVLPQPSTATLPSSMRRSYRDRSGSGPPSGSRSPGPAAGPALLRICLGRDSWHFRSCGELGELCVVTAVFADREAVSGWSVSYLQV